MRVESELNDNENYKIYEGPASRELCLSVRHSCGHIKHYSYFSRGNLESDLNKFLKYKCWDCRNQEIIERGNR